MFPLTVLPKQKSESVAFSLANNVCAILVSPPHLHLYSQRCVYGFIMEIITFTFPSVLRVKPRSLFILDNTRATLIFIGRQNHIVETNHSYSKALYKLRDFYRYYLTP